MSFLPILIFNRTPFQKKNSIISVKLTFSRLKAIAFTPLVAPDKAQHIGSILLNELLFQLPGLHLLV